MCIDILKQYKQFVLILQNIANTRNHIINKSIISRANVNNDSDPNIFRILNDFPDHGSRDETDYYEQNNYMNKSHSVSMVSSDINNEEDGNMNINQQLPLPNAGTYKLIFNNSKHVSNIKSPYKILHKNFIINYAKTFY